MFHEAFREIERSVARFAIEFEAWLEPIGDVIELIKILPKQITSVGNGILQLPDKEDTQKFLLIMALYRGYLYGEYFVNSDRYKIGAKISFVEHNPKEIMDIMFEGRKEGDNLADRLDLFFHILVRNSKNSSIQIGKENPEDSDVELYMMMGLMIRFSELKFAHKDDMSNRLNEIIMLQPNFMGIGVNFNKILNFLIGK